MKKFLKISILLITLYCLLFIVVPLAQAQGEIFAGMSECREKGNCTLDDFLRLGVNAANIIMRIVGVAALVMFVVGGIHWLTAGGREGQIKRGKAIIAGAVMGLFLIFFSWFIVRALQDVMQVREKYRIIGWAKNCSQVIVDDETIQAPDGTPCGESPDKDENRVCKDGQCISKCKAYYEDKGYECEDISCECRPNCTEEELDKCVSERGCMRGLCPEGDYNVCCKK